MGKSNIPTYIEIYSNLYRKILEGVYKEGDQIPTELRSEEHTSELQSLE